MKELAGYKITDLIYDGTRTLVYRGVKEKEQIAVVIKKPRQQYPTFNELLQLRHQYALTKNLELAGIVKPIALEKDGNSYALVMEDVGGISLTQYYQNRPLNLEEFFHVAIALTKILAGLYQHRVIHKDIKPDNIPINPETKEIFLIDFSIASLLPRETQQLQNPNQLEGTLAYISPEQTGRMNRGIDYRSDFYSLGVTFYQLLAGQLPFVSDDAMELVHSHIAKKPTPLHAVKPEIPEMVSAIVMKLMAKTAEERYQSAKGLERDLTECRQQWQKSGKIDRFELGHLDLSDRFCLPEKLYGRETEVQALLDSFDRVAAGSTSLMLVAGFSGIGKTAVVSEIDKPIVEKRGYFILGKFDQFNRNKPLSAFVIALGDLMEQLLGESDAAIERRKRQILGALGEQAKVIIDVIPQLENIIGVQPEVSELSGNAAQNRFNLLFGKFIRVFATAEHPLVIFLDDLQWADSASLKSIQLLLGETGISEYLLLIGAYRDNEVSPVHPLMVTLEEIGKTGATVNTITIAPLPQTEINRLVADTLSCAPDLALPLTELVYQKAKGNPFFTNQFLKSLHEDGWIEFNFEVGYWQCDITKVRELSLTEDVVELMATRISKLPFASRELLKLAACAGNQFDLATLAIIGESSETEAAASLWVALREGLVLPLDETYKFYGDRGAGEESEGLTIAPERSPHYKFLHDRVQQAAYSLIPESQKETTHYRIGQLLLEQIPPELREERLFEIVGQLNYGTDLIAEQKQRDELAQLNLMASLKARSATAYQGGLEYARTGLSLLGENPWQRQYETCLAFHDLLAELLSLCGDLEGMEEIFQIAIARTKSIVETVNVYCIKILSKVSQNQLNQAIAIAREFLQQLGVTFPKNPTQEDIQQSIADINKLLAGLEIEDLADLPPIADKKPIAILEIASSIIPAAYISGSPLFPLLVAFSVKTSIECGNIASSVLAYAAYGVLACNMLQNVDVGVKFGRLALGLVSKLDAKSVKHEALHVAAAFILHRKSHIKEALPLSLEGYVAALEVGNFEYVGYNAHSYCLNAFWSSAPLATVERGTRAYCHQLQQLNQLTTGNWCRIYWQSMLNLLGASEDSTVLSGEVLQEELFLPPLLEARDLTGLFLFYLYKLMLCYLFGDIESANNHAVEVRRYFMGGAGIVAEPAFYFYDSSIALASFSSGSREQKAQLLQRVEENQTQLQQQWADHAPMNHQHKVDLVAAQKCRVLGQKTEAIELYDKAIAGAAENEFIQEEALANELAAKFYLDWGKEKVAAGYMQDAYYCYARWGAKAKIADLERRYPQLLAPIFRSEKTPHATSTSISQITQGTVTSTSMESNTLLDFSSAFKASMAISGEIELFGLLSKLMEVVMENAGATKSVLLLPKGDTLAIEIVAAYSEDGILQMMSLGRSLPLESSEDIPQTIVNTVKRAREPVVVNDVTKETRFASDSYLVRCQPKSILVMPLNDGGQLRGILYLENRVTTGVFSGDRLEILKLIAAQAAISLQNVRLYQDLENANQTLEQKVEERTQELNEKNQDLQATLRKLKQTQGQLIQTEKMSSLGRMVGGIAHEINNPTSFIFGNLHHAKDYVQDLLDLIEVYQEDFPNGSDRVWDKREEIELDYIKEDLEQLFSSMTNGCDRIRSIVKGLRTFSRLDESKMKFTDLHADIESTIMLLEHRLRNAELSLPIEVIKIYGNLPKVTCYVSQVNQVFFHILSNAIDAIYSKAEYPPSDPPTVKIITETMDGQMVKITIGDNGEGMNEETRVKIFDPFFTTKPVGKGTGLGLSTSYQIIVGEHGGNLTCSSQLGKGTEFVITLPVLPLKPAVVSHK